MQLSLARDGQDRLTCVISDGLAQASIAVSDRRAASSGLIAAIDSALVSGSGECFWPQAAGEYRWMFRRNGEKLRIAVLWSTGTLTGWEHVFWSECDFAAFAGQVRAQVRAAAL